MPVGARSCGALVGSEETMDRPQVITKQQLQNPPAEQTSNIQRGQAFAHDRVWAGFVDFPGGTSTGWHHHGDYATTAMSPAEG